MKKIFSPNRSVWAVLSGVHRRKRSVHRISVQFVGSDAETIIEAASDKRATGKNKNGSGGKGR